ncbi:hypothetical protein ONA92_21270 [Mycobacteroides salmoniphilum]|uniref:hypothetical protein n=1 Tax=Mycobacteroides salmoniphilum TaxID=404941 RepID=UPI0035628276
MNDPAIEAAQRADLDGDAEPIYWSTTRDAMEEAAREALEPIRDWSAKWSIELLRRDLGKAWRELAPLVFSSEEL